MFTSRAPVITNILGGRI